ncbi:OmpA family lipoprotein [Salmonella enterica subsp. enterica serovar Enteritidis]|nr:OmpA family lipoprotein [Salmonella enterica subsp. enterica serovar Enteritidis]EEF0158685.1 OmpA family protein [Salmonella enterica subsp. enterica serovar Enteritidis]EEM1809887.1 OmpA family protein [Salmonella enterica subsp. enterica serovar Enteritidis]EHJ1150008.1 OmpA family protein [Salmonella enterica]HCZ2361932.1 OmpA family protein [Salmonella enterica subsp. enterica serovar Enteritidis]
MKKRVFVIAAIVSGALAVSGCTTNPYTGEREAGKSGIGAGIGSLVGAGIGALSSSKKDRGKGALTGVAMVLKEYPKTAVNVVGYTDSTGSHDLNMRLSQQRADSVASSLITQGVDASRIRTSGMGPANPIASNSTAEGKAQNRRVEITLSPLQ